MYETEAAINFDNPTSLFKYRGFDRFGLQGLIDDKIWLAAPSTFNDPLDCKFQVLKKSNDQELLEHVNACAEARNQTRRWRIDDIPTLRSDIEKVLADLKDGIKNAGVACFVASPFEPSMWAHYADGHRGFCVEYERTPDNELGDPAGCVRVDYADQAFSVFADLDFFRDPKRVLKQVLATKAVSWRREREWRLVRMWKAAPTDRGHRLNARVMSVTFGLNTPRRDALTIVRALRKKGNVEFFTMATPQEKLVLNPMPFHFSEDEL